MSKTKILMLSASLFVLVGCGNRYESFIEDQAEHIAEEHESESKSSESDLTLDERIVPEFNQIEKALLNTKTINISKPALQVKERFSEDFEDVLISIENFAVYDVDEADKSLIKEYNFEDEAGAIIYVGMTIANQRGEDIKVPVDNFRLSFLNGSQQAYPSRALYFLPNGNLGSIMQNAENILPAESYVEGYLAFGIGKEMYKEMKASGFFTLNTEFSLSNNVALMDNFETKIHLPLTEKTKASLINNELMLADRLSTEWWGDKTLLAEAKPNERVRLDKVTVSLDKIQITDFKPFKTYKSAFENFLNGQIIVTAEFTVKNNSEKVLLPIDGQATLLIGEDKIFDDYLLINQLYNQRLEPGEEMTVIRSFALDKMRYFDHWQNEEMSVSLTIPTLSEDEPEEESSADEKLNESVDPAEALSNEPSLEENALLFEWKYQPKLLKWINIEMDVVDNLDEDNSSVSSGDDEFANTDESEEKSDESQVASSVLNEE